MQKNSKLRTGEPKEFLCYCVLVVLRHFNHIAVCSYLYGFVNFSSFMWKHQQFSAVPYFDRHVAFRCCDSCVKVELAHRKMFKSMLICY